MFIDANDNGVLDAGERVAITRRKGIFSFSLPSGRYVVRQVPPSGSQGTGPGRYVVKLGRVKAATGINFGSRSS